MSSGDLITSSSGIVAAPITSSPGTSMNVGRVAASLARGAVVYAAANLGVRAFNFLLLPLYTRFLAPSDYGTITLAESIAMAVSAVAGLGLSGSVARLYFQYADDTPTLRSYTSSVISFAIASAFLAAGIAIVAGPTALRIIDPHFSVSFFPFVATAVLTTTAQVLIDFRQVLFQCEQRPGAFAALTIGIFFMTAAAVIWLVVIARRGAEGMLLGKCIAAIVAALVSLVLLWPCLHARMHWDFIRESLQFGLPLIPHQFIALGLVVADRFILERYRNLGEVGLYSVAYGFGTIMLIVTLSISQAWSPIYFDTANKGDGGRRVNGRVSSGLVLLLVGIAIIGVVVADEFVRRVLDVRYADAGRLIPWIIAGYLLHALFTLFHFAVLQGKRTMWLWPVSALALVANVVLNFLLVPHWGMYGAAWATTAAYGLEALGMYWCAQRAYRLPYQISHMLMALMTLSFVLAVSQRAWPAPARIPVLAVTLVGGIGFLGLLGREDLRQGVAVLLRRHQDTL
jgi:O-antigen/teichoic acid export membrane protein